MERGEASSFLHFGIHAFNRHQFTARKIGEILPECRNRRLQEPQNRFRRFFEQKPSGAGRTELLPANSTLAVLTCVKICHDTITILMDWSGIKRAMRSVRPGLFPPPGPEVRYEIDATTTSNVPTKMEHAKTYTPTLLEQSAHL